MKYVPKQCKVCPFRKTSAQGWLGSYTAATAFSSIWDGIPFLCHDSIDYTKPGCLEEAVANPRKGKLCVGGLVFANKIHATAHVEYPLILEAREKVRVRTDIECMEPKDFLAHHPDWQAEERQQTARQAKSVEVPQENDEPGPGKCHGCRKAMGDEAYCFGCKKHICDDCDKNNNLPWGGHRAEAHFKERVFAEDIYD